MAHRIGRHEAIAPALRRLFDEDLRQARAELCGHGPREARVHRVRQRLKRLRSLLVVVRPAMGDYAVEAKHALAEAAHLLAGARDADAAAASARDLRAAVGASADAGLDRVVAEFDRKAAEAHRHAMPFAEVDRRLAAVGGDLFAFPGEVDGETLLRRAILHTYRDGRRAMHRAGSSLATPDLHRWRKAVKSLWHLLRLARRRLPKSTAVTAKRLARLGEVLGHDHDHAMLAERLALSPTGDPALMRQLALIATERRSLEQEAFALGARLYRRKPKRYARRLRIR